MQGNSGTAASRGDGGQTTNWQRLRLQINPPRWKIDDRTVIFQFTRDGGWFWASFGDGAEYMRAAEEDPVLRARISARAERMLRGRPALDSDLARVIAAVELAKDYDPNQPRDEQGRWTSDGTAAAAAGVAAGTARMYADSAYATGLKEIAARALAAAARTLPAAAAAIGDAATAAAAPATAFFGTMFFPTPRHLDEADGAVSGAPDYTWHFDQEAGHLTIAHQLDDGSSETVFNGRYDQTGVFRDESGNAIGRYLGDSVALDADAVRGYEARQRSDAQAPPGAIAQTDTATRSEPKLCPDPTVESLAGRKEPGILYQSQISGLPPGFDFKLPNPDGGNPVSYDACWDDKNGAMGDAKGPNYFKFMVDPNHWRDWYQGLGKLEDQMERQSHAATGRMVEWHFAEEGPAEFFKQYVDKNRKDLPNISVFYTPPVN